MSASTFLVEHGVFVVSSVFVVCRLSCSRGERSVNDVASLQHCRNLGDFWLERGTRPAWCGTCPTWGKAECRAMREPKHASRGAQGCVGCRASLFSFQAQRGVGTSGPQQRAGRNATSGAGQREPRDAKKLHAKDPFPWFQGAQYPPVRDIYYPISFFENLYLHFFKILWYPLFMKTVLVIENMAKREMTLPTRRWRIAERKTNYRGMLSADWVLLHKDLTLSAARHYLQIERAQRAIHLTPTVEQRAFT